MQIYRNIYNYINSGYTFSIYIFLIQYFNLSLMSKHERNQTQKWTNAHLGDTRDFVSVFNYVLYDVPKVYFVEIIICSPMETCL